MNASEQRQQVQGTAGAHQADGTIRVELDDGRCINAELSAKIKVRFMAIVPGARVRCELSPVVAGKARIVGLAE
jgi:translation initiation factor IF-1